MTTSHCVLSLFHTVLFCSVRMFSACFICSVCVLRCLLLLSLASYFFFFFFAQKLLFQSCSLPSYFLFLVCSVRKFSIEFQMLSSCSSMFVPVVISCVRLLLFFLFLHSNLSFQSCSLQVVLYFSYDLFARFPSSVRVLRCSLSLLSLAFVFCYFPHTILFLLQSCYLQIVFLFFFKFLVRFVHTFSSSFYIRSSCSRYPLLSFALITCFFFSLSLTRLLSIQSSLYLPFDVTKCVLLISLLSSLFFFSLPHGLFQFNPCFYLSFDAIKCIPRFLVVVCLPQAPSRLQIYVFPANAQRHRVPF